MHLRPGLTKTRCGRSGGRIGADFGQGRGNRIQLALAPGRVDEHAQARLAQGLRHGQGLGRMQAGRGEDRLDDEHTRHEPVARAGGDDVGERLDEGDVVGDRLGVKASGGIRDYDTAVAMIEAGASRLGLSGTAAVHAWLQRSAHTA